MQSVDLQFSITPFYVTRQYYYALETGAVVPDGVDLSIEYNHSPVKDHVLVCGSVDATTMSMGKFLLVKSISDTYALPVDPMMAGASLTYERGNGLYVRDDGDVDDPTDLEGKRLGIHDRSMVLTYHKAILDHVYDVDLDAIEWVYDTHQGLTRRMDEGDIDAVERVGDWYWNLDASPDHRRLYDMGEQWESFRGYYPMVHLVAVNGAYQQDHPAAVDSFVDALQASTKYRDEHYEEILEAFASEEDSQTEWTGERDVEDLRRITSTSRCPFTLGEPQKRNIREWMEYAVEYDVLSEPVPEERIYV